MIKKKFSLIVKLCLISLYVIFLAGSVVRMTGSGMGCPDWPKCFGYYIPPTSEEQLLWKPNTTFKKGTVIIKNESLLVAKSEFTTASEFEMSYWNIYEKHDYALFNVYHTWTEYVNRLASVVSGFFFLFLIIGAFSFRKENKWITIWSFTAFFLMLFEAWLGKTVVDSVLSPSIITVHMVVGLIIVALIITVQYLTKKLHFHSKSEEILKDTTFTRVLRIAAIFSLIQIALGTQVRQFVDEQVHLLGFENKQLSLLQPDLKFYIHRSFTIAIVLVNGWLFYRSTLKKYNYSKLNWILVLLGLETISGILMYYVDFPIGTQTLHLLFGVFLFSLQYALILDSKEN